MLIETFIRKQLRLKAHTVTKVEETDECMLVWIDRLGRRLLRCGVCWQRCLEVHDIRKEREWRDPSMRGQARDVVIVRGAVSPDHIHLLLAAPPILAPAKLAQYIKGRSSRHQQAEFPELRKRYWGQHMWARAYFCATVGAVDESTIKGLYRKPKVGR